MSMVTAAARPAIRLAIRQTDGTEYDLALSGERDRYVIGRQVAHANAGVEVQLNDRFVSRRHAEFIWEETMNRWGVRDLNSSNGTQVEEEPVYNDHARALFDGARVKVGSTLLTIRFEEGGMMSSLHGDEAPGPTVMIGHDGRIIDTSDQPGMTDAPEGATVMFPGGAIPFGHSGDEEAGGETIQYVPGMRDSLTQGPMTQVPSSSSLTTGFDPSTDGTTIYGAGLGAAASAVASADAGQDNQTVMETGTYALDVRPPPIPAEAPVSRRPQPAAAPRPRPEPVPAAPSAVALELTGIAQDLVDANLLDAHKAINLAKAARDSGRTFFRELSRDGTIKFQDEIYRQVASKLSLDLIDAEKTLMDRAVGTDWLPLASATERMGVVLLGGAQEENTVPYATVDPFDLVIDDWIARHAGKPTRKCLVTPTAFQAAMQRLISRPNEEEVGASVLVIDVNSELVRRIQAKVEDVEVPQIVNYFLQKAFNEGASDIHVEPTEDFLLVRNRVDGMLHDAMTLPGLLHAEVTSRLKILSGMDVAEKRRPQDGRIASMIRDHAIDIRVSSYPTIYGEKVVMRLLDKDALRPSPAHLGMMPRDLRLLYDKIDAPFGLIMISGPTGSGKTTTLYSCLSHIDKKTRNVMTVEDPVEYRLRGVHQMQVNEKIGLTFASGLRTLLRQDPDVIMVGECRDQETAAMAIQASLTGHIVFSTIHTNDAIGVVTRLLDMGIDSFLVANSVSLAIAQRLVRKICPHCQTPYEGSEILMKLQNEGVSRERLEDLGIDIDPNLTYVRGTGCNHCRGTGYRGRQAVFEVFEMTRDARNMIMSEHFNADELRRYARESGMTTLIKHGMMQIEEGITTHEEVIRVLGESY